MTLISRINLFAEQVGLDMKSIQISTWKLTGNAGTNPTNNFIGTTDAQPLVFKTDNIERAKLLSNGNFKIFWDDNPNNAHSYFEANINSISPSFKFRGGNGNLGVDIGYTSGAYPYIKAAFGSLLIDSPLLMEGNGNQIFGRNTNFHWDLYASGYWSINDLISQNPYFRVMANTGNVLINTSTDAGYKFDVNGTSFFRDKLEMAYQKVIRASSGGIELRRGDDTGNGTLFGTIKYNSGDWIMFNKTIGSGTGIYGHASFSDQSVSMNLGYYGSVFKSTGLGNWEWEFKSGTTTANGLLKITNNTTSVFEVKGSGNILIGTSVDSGYKLRVNGSVNINTLMINTLPNVSILGTDGNGNLINNSSILSSITPTIQEYRNKSISNPVGDSLYYNKKTTDTGEVRMYIMGMPIYTQKNEIFLEANTSEGVKQIGLK